MALDLMGMFSGSSELFNFSGIVAQIFYIIRIFGLFVIVAGAMYFYSKKKKSQNLKIGWWEEVNGRLIPLNVDDCLEIIPPGTNLKVFYIKTKDLWLPRFTRGITKDLFYVAITPDREIVNFSLKSLSEDRKEAGLEYDHTDMRWAAENTKEFIKRNYRDKSTKWWQLYKDTIATVVFIVILTISMAIIIYMLTRFTGQLGTVSGSLSSAVDKLNMCAPQPTSGVITS